MVRMLLTRDAGLRPSASAALQHPWFRSQKSYAGQQVPLDAAVLAAMSSFASSGKMRKMAIRAMARCGARPPPTPPFARTQAGHIRGFRVRCRHV